MNTSVWIAVLTSLAFVEPQNDRAAELRTELRQLEARIEKLESADREVPDELYEEAETLTGELEELEEWQEAVDWTLETVQKISPEAASELREIQKRDPEEFHGYVEDLAEILRELEDTREENPTIYRMERSSLALNLECEALARKTRSAEDDARSALREDLRERLGRLFTVRLELRKHEIERLEAELLSARRQVERMSKDRNAMIEQRMKQMLDAEDDDW